jgi:BirA family biotin operon repressor/biotin-[acetyl-CoA-carboxylase] ligase
VLLTLRHHFEVVGSTQEVALRLAREGAPEGTYVVADRQEAGRGRLDHSWASPAGGLYLSLVLSEPARALSLAPIAFALAVSDTVGAYGATTTLKWPNDVLAFGSGSSPRKLAGVLVDRVVSPSLGHGLVAGVGINVAAPPADPASDLDRTMIQLNDLTPTTHRPSEVEDDLVPRLRAANEALRTRGGQLQTVARCRAALYGRGQPARLDGKPIGTLQELDEDGSLWVEHEGRRENVRAGHLEFGLA